MKNIKSADKLIICAAHSTHTGDRNKDIHNLTNSTHVQFLELGISTIATCTLQVLRFEIKLNKQIQD